MASIFHQRYTVKDANGKTVRKQSQYWYIDYKAAGETRKRVKGFKDKTATAQLAAKLEKEAELADAGIIDRYKEHRKRPLTEHLKDFGSCLTGRGITAKYIQQVVNQLEIVFKSCGFAYIADITASSVQRFIGELKRTGSSHRTCNYYLKTLKQFCSWLVADNRTAENPLAYLKGLNTQTDIRRKRRALNIDEINRLIEVAAESPEHHLMSGQERAMLYTLAVNTGLRAGELASLTWQSFNLNDSTPFVTVLAAYSKHRRDDTIPLRPDVAGLFTQWQTERNEPMNAKIFPNLDKVKTAEMLRKDFEIAGIDYIDKAGRVADFHALRHTFISNLSQGGVSPKVAQSLARHSTITLTMDTYTHVQLYDERAALEKLPDLPNIKGGDKRQSAVALKSGTDDLPMSADESAYKPAYKKLAKNAYSNGDRLSTIDTANRAIERVNSANGACDKPISEGQLGNEGTSLSLAGSSENKNGRYRNRTCDPLIKSQLLYLAELIALILFNFISGWLTLQENYLTMNA